jgi:hypothetical protein
MFSLYYAQFGFQVPNLSLLSQGKSVRETARQLEVSEQTYYPQGIWWSGYIPPRKLKELEKELVFVIMSSLSQKCGDLYKKQQSRTG